MMRQRSLAVVLTLLAALLLPVSAFAQETGPGKIAEDFPEISGMTEEPPEEEGPEEPFGDEEVSSGDPGAAASEEPTSPDSPEKEDQELTYPFSEEHVIYLNGDNDLVRPEAGLRRSEAAKIIYSLLEAPAEAEGGRFPDVPLGKWYQPYVDSLAEMGILKGYADGFHPDQSITRAEFVTILSRLFEQEEAGISFSDVPEEHWAYEAVSTCVAKGWLSGYSDGTFRPEKTITRAEAVTFINRILDRTADKARIDQNGKILQFIDLPLDHWAYYSMMEASVPHSFSYDEGSGEKKEVWGEYTPVPAQRSQGPHLQDGQLYYVGNDGYYVRNQTIGLLAFDTEGRYTTGDRNLDDRLTQIVRAQIDPASSNYDNLGRLYRYVKRNYSYLSSYYVAIGTTGWENEFAAPMLSRGKGNCYNYAALFALLARKLGYQAHAVSGELRTDFWSWDTHGWVEIVQNGVTYFCDPEFEGVYVVNHGLGWDLFMKRYGTTPTRYRIGSQYLG